MQKVGGGLRNLGKIRCSQAQQNGTSRAKKLPRYVRPEHFTAIYQACDLAKRPRGHPYAPADRWRAFATMNARKLSGDALQALMRHKSYQTTQRYIDVARQLDEAVEVLHVPEVLKTGLAS